MKKTKIKRKLNKNFFSIRFFLLLFIVIIIFSSYAYALFTEGLTISGTVSGQRVFTYYFSKPDNWRSSSLHAHIWINGGTGTSWPGLEMTYYTTQNGKEIYKVDVTSDMAFYSGHNYIIFNDYAYSGDSQGKQTINIPFDPFSDYNKLFACGSSSNKQILAFNRFNDWPGTKVYAYLWNSSTNQKNATWPGVEITNNLISENLYAIEVDPNAYNYIIFNNGTDFSDSSKKRQTADLSISSTNDMRYDGSWHNIITGTWSNFISPTILTPSHTHN